jgi:2-isopropylmalate synthase
MNNPQVNIEIFDTTLRDGAQSLPEDHQFKPGMKAQIASDIARLGVSVIEAGFPATPADAAEVKAVAETVGNCAFGVMSWNSSESVITKRIPRIAGLARASMGDIEATWEALSPAAYARIHTFIPTDAAHMRAKFPGMTPEQVMDIGIDAVRFANQLTEKQTGADVEFSAEAASTTEAKFLEWVIKGAIQAGANVINVPDTVGQRDPFWMRGFYAKVIDWVMNEDPSVTISAHNHNDIDQATANTLALVFAAADQAIKHGRSVGVQLETSICGLGERAGNADVFPVVAGIHKFVTSLPSEVTWSFNPINAVSIANTVMGYVGFNVDRQSPVVGADIKVHRSGIHSDGIVKGGHRIYTPHDPTFWGHESDAVHEDGRYQGTRGRSAIQIGVNDV